jgi:hypothetical protein
MSATTKAKARRLVDRGMPNFSAALDLIEQRTRLPFDAWVKRPRPQRVDHHGRRLVPVLSIATLKRVAGGGL